MVAIVVLVALGVLFVAATIALAVALGATIMKPGPCPAPDIEVAIVDDNGGIAAMDAAETVGVAYAIHIPTRMDRKPNLHRLQTLLADLVQLEIWNAHTGEGAQAACAQQSALRDGRRARTSKRGGQGGCRLSKGQLGCARSHISAIRAIGEDPRQFKWGLVFEDDACPSVPDAEVVSRMRQALREAPPLTPYVQFGFCHDRHYAQARVGKFTWVGPAGLCSHAYAVRKSAAAAIANKLEARMCMLPIDDAMAQIVPNALFVYGDEHRRRVAPDTPGYGMFGQTFETPSAIDQRLVNVSGIRRLRRKIADVFLVRAKNTAKEL
jgi:hypothetical protein